MESDLTINVEAGLVSITISASGPGFSDLVWVEINRWIFFRKSEALLQKQIDEKKDIMRRRYKICQDSRENTEKLYPQPEGKSCLESQ